MSAIYARAGGVEGGAVKTLSDVSFRPHATLFLSYTDVASLSTGNRGWKDNGGRGVDLDDADVYFTLKLRPDQMRL